MTIEYTTNRGYPKPDFDTRTWHDQMHTSLDMIDSDMQFAAITSGDIPTLWTNNHLYSVNDLVVDTSNQTIYQCVIGHTSAAAGTFAADRAAHPTFWLSQGVPFTNVSYTWGAIQEFLGGWTTGATGGSKGNNTWNAGTLYENGVALSSKYVSFTGGVINGPLVLPAGTVAATSINFGTPGTGVWSGVPASRIDFAISGVNRLSIQSATIQFGFPVFAVDGISAGPAYSFALETNTGWYRAGAGDIRLSIGGADAAKWLASDKSLSITGPINEGGIPISQRYAGGYRNILRRNGGLEIWQRTGGVIGAFLGTSGGVAYTADGWYIGTVAGQSANVSAIAGITNGSQLAAKVYRPAGVTAVTSITFGFPLDTDELFAILGQFVRVSFTAKAGANFSAGGGNLSVAVAYGTGTPVKYQSGYTGGVLALIGTAALTTTPARFSFVTSAVIPITSRQAEVFFAYTPSGTAGADDSFIVDDVQLEVVQDIGQAASLFERLIFTEQLLLCQRHYWKSFNYATAPATNSGNRSIWIPQVVPASTIQRGFHFSHPVRMRITNPSGTTYNPSAANAQIRGQVTTSDWSATAINVISDMAFTILGTTNVGSSVGEAGALNVDFDAGI